MGLYMEWCGTRIYLFFTCFCSRNSQAIEGDTDTMSEISNLPCVRLALPLAIYKSYYGYIILRHDSLLEGEDDSTFSSMDPVSTKPTTQYLPSIPALQHTCGTQDFDSTPPRPTIIRVSLLCFATEKQIFRKLLLHPFTTGANLW